MHFVEELPQLRLECFVFGPLVELAQEMSSGLKSVVGKGQGSQAEILQLIVSAIRQSAGPDRDIPYYRRGL